MFTLSRLRRSVILGALACALLAATTSAVAAAQPNDDAHCRVQLGAGLPLVPCSHSPDRRHKSTLGPSADSPRLIAGQAQERYYTSYGTPESIVTARPPTTADDSHWLTLVLSIAAALVVVVLSALSLGKVRIRLRRASVESVAAQRPR